MITSSTLLTALAPIGSGRRIPVAAVAAGTLALTAGSAFGADLEQRYIVTLRDGIRAADTAQRVAGTHPDYVYRGVLNGFAAQLDGRQLDRLRHDPAVRSIERDTVVRATATDDGSNWGLDRIDQHFLPLSATFASAGTGAGVTAYVIDTGVDPTHPEFEGRARVAFDAFGGDGVDCDGHGTHVAGIIGSRTFGVAKSVQLAGVRVLNCKGNGSNASVIAGLDWVRLHRAGPSVANLSLGGSPSAALDRAVDELVDSGVFVTVAAGNEAVNACSESPSRVRKAYTVAATTATDRAPRWSNFGTTRRNCVDGFAPGVGIRSTYLHWQTERMAGSSMAAPHVAGVAALALGVDREASPAKLTTLINVNATAGAVVGAPSGTPNRLLYMGGL